jgi:hypothetical protein
VLAARAGSPPEDDLGREVDVLCPVCGGLEGTFAP